MDQELAKTVERWRHDVRAALPAADADLIDEIAQFVAERWLDARALGISLEQADAEAQRDIVAWRSRPEASRALDRRTVPWFGWGSDLRLATRAWRVHPSFAIVASTLCAIAVAAVVSAFAIIYGILVRPLPYPQGERLAVLWMNGGSVQISYPDFTDLSTAPVFDGAALISGGRASLRIGDRIERVNLLGIEAQGLGLLGATPHAGRLLRAADAGQPNVMISHRLWTTQLQSDPRIVGSTLWMNANTYTVVGVLKRGFDFELPIPPLFKLKDNDVWLVPNTAGAAFARRDYTGYEALVRLAPGRSLQDAQNAVDAVSTRLAAEHPLTNGGRTFRVAPLLGEITQPVRRPLMLAGAAALVTLAVALVNLAMLGLVRGLQRQQELCVREALGAGAARLRRQLLTEYGLIGTFGALIGVFASRTIVRWLLASQALGLPRVDAIHIDGAALAAAGIVLVLAVLALVVTPLGLQSTLTATARTVVRHGRTSRIMVATEIALAFSLATAAVLFAVSLQRLLAVETGFDPHGGAAARVSTYAASYPNVSDVVRLYDRILERLRATPDVAAAGVSSSLPLSGQSSGTGVLAEGEIESSSVRRQAGWEYVSPGYFGAVGLRLRAGRDFAADDSTRQPHVTVINESLARALFGDANPIGRRIGVGGGERQGDWHEVVGVVADVRHSALDASPTPRVYDLFGQHWGRTMFVAVKSRTGNAAPLLAMLRQVVAAQDPEAPVFEGETLQALVNRSVSGYQVASSIAMSLAGAALALALIGVYAIAATRVSERTRELGVRAALGASPRELFGVIAREFVALTMAGGIAGIGASILTLRVMRAQLFGVSNLDAVWIVPLVGAAVLLCVLIGVTPPARRAARIDPIDAMRLE